MQQKTSRAVQFERLSDPRASFLAWPERRAVQILLGHSKIENTVRYFGIDVEDALALAENTEI